MAKPKRSKLWDVDRPSRVVLYVRTSTKHQDAASQLEELRAIAAERAYQVIAECVDDAVSSRRTERPELQRALELVMRGKAEAIVVTELSRVSRSTRELLRLVDNLGKFDGGLIDLRRGIDTTQRTALSRLVMTVFTAFAEFERELTSERTIERMQRLAERGVKLGRPKKPRKLNQGHVVTLRKLGVPWSLVEKWSGCVRTTIVRDIRQVGKYEIPREDGALLADAAASWQAVLTLPAWCRPGVTTNLCKRGVLELPPKAVISAAPGGPSVG